MWRLIGWLPSVSPDNGKTPWVSWPHFVVQASRQTKNRPRTSSTGSWRTCCSTSSQAQPLLVHTEVCKLLSCASPTIDFQNTFSNPRQTQLLWHIAGSSPLNDVNYPATNDSNTPENSSELSDIALPCRSRSFKCKSAFIFTRHRNSSLYTHSISNW